jgi:hypothetical protein
VAVHDALHKIIPLHTVLVTGSIGKLSERGLAEVDLFEAPIIVQVQADAEPDRPVVCLAFDLRSDRTAL